MKRARRLAAAYTLGSLLYLGIVLMRIGAAVVVFAKRRIVANV